MFNVPDEFVQGLLKSGAGLWQSFVGGVAAPAKPEGADGHAFAAAQARYGQQQMALWTAMAVRALGQSVEPVIAPASGDRRFGAAEWRDTPVLDLLKQSYLINAQLVDGVVEAAAVDARTRHRLRFYARQVVDSMSPANFAALNPDVLKRALATQGQSTQDGMRNLLGDLRKGRISITDETAFEVGRNVATSAGAVVYENELMQLIQYAPLTKTVAQRPLLIVPPCINKFYILDLQPDNSFVRFAVEQGHTVFLVSWRNPPPELGQTTWDDYLSDGAMKAIAVALQISRTDQVNAVGWCVGGTILSSALAVLRARGDDPVASLTLLTTMLDFEQPGDLGVFIDEEGVRAREASIGNGGIHPGAELAFVFQALRANDLIWPYVIDNYLKGQAPSAFDLLYWNADATNLPGPMYSWYLRNMYLENRLCKPGALAMCGVDVDLGRIDMPSFVLATAEDHIVPWKAAYRSGRLLGGESQFVLGASGHIAGVINPAARNRRSYWIAGAQGEDPERWLASAKPVQGSWWTHWSRWLAPLGGKQVPARTRLGGARFKVIEAAPGRYVKVRSESLPTAATA